MPTLLAVQKLVSPLYIINGSFKQSSNDHDYDLLFLFNLFLGPVVTRPFMGDHPDQCVAGFLLGFTISVFLWMKVGRHYAK